MKKSLYKACNRIIQFIQVQLFISLASLPIVVSWGIPFSIVTVIGNFLFSPFLTLFLLVSSLVFFTELFCIPNEWFIFLLEHISLVWLHLLSWGSKEWLIGFPAHSVWIACLGSFFGFVVMQHKFLGRRLISVIFLLGISFGTVYFLSCTQPYSQEIKVPCGKKEVKITTFGKTVILKDCGLFSVKKSRQSWVQYTLLPEIIKKTGLLDIELIIVDNADGATFEVLKEIIFNARVKKIVLPYFIRTLTSREWRSFYEFKKIASQQKCIITRSKE